MQLFVLFIALGAVTALNQADGLHAANTQEVFASDLWKALTNEPHDIKKLKQLYDSIAIEPEKIKELANYREPVSTFLTKLASLEATEETAAILESLLALIKDMEIRNKQEQLDNAYHVLNPGCMGYEKNRPKGESLYYWQKEVIALSRYQQNPVCGEYFNLIAFIEAIVKVGNENDLIKLIKNVDYRYKLDEFISLLQKYFNSDIQSDKNNVNKRKFIDIFLDVGKHFGPIRSRIQERIKKPYRSKRIYTDDPSLLKEILKKIEERSFGDKNVSG